MKKHLPVLAFLFAAPLCLPAQDFRSLSDFYNEKMLYYTDQYKDIKNNPFNLFDEVSADYPVLKDYPAASAKLYHYCVSYLETDSFKLELLQRSKLASDIYFTNSGERSLYEYNNRQNFLPQLKDADYEFVFLFNGLLAVNLKYSYELRVWGNSNDPEFVMVKPLFVRLSDGAVFRVSDLLLPQKQNAMKSDVEALLKDYFTANRASIEKNMLEDSSDDDDSDDGEDGGGDSDFRRTPPAELVLNDLPLDISPFGVNARITEYSVNSMRLMGMGCNLPLDREKFKTYIDPAGPLGKLTTYNKTFSSELRNVNMYRELRQRDWMSAFNIQRDNNIMQPAPGKDVKTVSYYIAYKNSPDSLRQLQRRKQFDASGRLTAIEYYDGSPGRPARLTHQTKFEYNTKGLLVRIVQQKENSDKKTKEEFGYDNNNNLVSYRKSGDEDDGDYSATYRFDGMTVYEVAREDDGTHKRVYTLNTYGRIVNSYDYGEQPQWIRYYDQDRELGSRSLKHPNLDNYLYCYDEKGKLLTVQTDNGRHLYEISYNEKGQARQMIYLESRQQRGLWLNEYNDQGLLRRQTYYNNMYGYSNADNVYRYSLEYEFY